MDSTSQPAELLRDRPFTTQDALDAGMSKVQLHRAVAAGWLRRPVRGVYVPASLPDTLTNRCTTLSLSVPADAFVCDHTAAWLLAGDRALVPGDHLATPDVSCFRLASGARLRRGDVRSGERAVLPHEIIEVGGLQVTSPLRTALDIGRLARHHDVRLHGMDTMLSLETFTLDELLDQIPRFKGQRGVVGLRVLAPLADGGSQSFGESALRLRWHEARLPRPVTQQPVPAPLGTTYFLDIALPEEMLAAEYDGEQFHSTPEQRAHDDERRRWIRRSGWELEEFRKEHVFGQRPSAEQRLRRVYAELSVSRRRRRYF